MIVDLAPEHCVLSSQPQEREALRRTASLLQLLYLLIEGFSYAQILRTPMISASCARKTVFASAAQPCATALLP